MATWYIDVSPDTRNENEEWGHFIDVDNALLSSKNRTRSVTCPVIHGNKVYQTPYGNYNVYDNNEQYKNLNYYRYPVLYIVEKIISPLLKLFSRKSNNNGTQKNVNIPVKVRSLLDIKTSKYDERVTTVSFRPTMAYNYTIDEMNEDEDEDDMYKSNKISVSIMATASIVTVYVLYILI